MILFGGSLVYKKEIISYQSKILKDIQTLIVVYIIYPFLLLKKLSKEALSTGFPLGHIFFISLRCYHPIILCQIVKEFGGSLVYKKEMISYQSKILKKKIT